MNKWFFTTCILLFLMPLLACESDESEFPVAYTGPLSEATNVELIFSDSAIVRINLTAARKVDLQNGDSEFPEGIFIKFYGKDGELSSTIKADKGYFIKEENLYRGEGDVVVINLAKDEKLFSEELFWSPKEKKIYTERAVRIESQTGLILGEGLITDENFTDYQIFKIRDGDVELSGN
ncbi:LPS export ABC transporter periplasmic protein LptC [Penaeicola halotolerans]|uniref:LPS export ABC transporter periplasmic protein LptC n=1 Tax=Penaeicola halotolerans TaxID=2793196 RepID=UPI001CF82189|nr:LPS export ABC transporter periplasmic protein LptC [Penaeicola halotolerans]